jgi:hypothetical protein
MEKVYKAKFWKDRIWVAVIPGFLGLVFLFAGIAGTIAGIHGVLKNETSFGPFVGVFFIFLLPFLMVGGLSFYIFLYGIRTKIIINDEFLILGAPLYKRKVAVRDIRKIAVGEKSMPIITYSGAGPAPVFFKSSPINVFYEKRGKIKKLQLPNWRKGYYLPQIVEDLRKINPNIQT